jgi:hypothetical protein
MTAPDSNRKIIEEVARHAYAHGAQTDRFPKILILAVNDIPHASHADQLVRISARIRADAAREGTPVKMVAFASSTSVKSKTASTSWILPG